MIILPELDPKWSAGGESAITATRLTRLEEALKIAVREEELRLSEKQILERAVRFCREEVNKVIKELAKKADKTELHKHESQLTDVNIQKSVNEPKKEEPKEPNLLEKLVAVIREHRK